MLQRLERIHYEQVAALDRSARYWEERIASERELARMAEAQEQTELDLKRVSEARYNQSAKSLLDQREVERLRLQEWVRGYNTRLMAEEAAVDKTSLLGSDREYLMQLNDQMAQELAANKRTSI